MAKISVSLEGITLQEVVLTQKTTTIGRRPYNDIPLEALSVSGEHAVVRLDDSGLAVLEDRDSTNGTFVNGQPIVEQLLRHGDVIGIGKYQLRFDAQDAGPGATLGSPPAQQPAAAPSGYADTQLPPGASRAFASTSAVIEPPPKARLRVLTGSGAGREMDLTKVVTTLGKSGIGVAAITRRGHGYSLNHVDGDAIPLVNGSPANAGPLMLQHGDLIELAGVRMQFALGG